MRAPYIFVFAVLVLVSCSKTSDTLTNPSALVPKSSSLVFKVNAPNDYKSSLRNNSLVSKLNENYATTISNHLEYLNPTRELLIATNFDSLNNYFAFITKTHNRLISEDSTRTTSRLENSIPEIFRTVYKKDTLFYRTIDSLFFGTNNLELAKTIDKNEVNINLTKLLDKSDRKKTVSVVFKNNSKASDILFMNTNTDKTLTDYSTLDFNIQTNSINYNGITKGQDSLFFINSFKNTKPQELKISGIIPENTSSFKRLAFDDYNVFSKNRARLKGIPNDSITNILHSSSEIASFEVDNEKVLALYALDADVLTQTLINSPSSETFRDIAIYAFEAPELFDEKLDPFITFENANYFFVFENFAIFSDSLETLKTVITSKLNANTLDNSEAFKDLLNDLADESSYFIYKNKEELSKILGNTDYNTNAVQFIYDTGFAHVNASLKAYKKPARRHSVTEHFSVSLVSDLLSDPQTVKNHITNGYDIVVQDVKNVVYLISNSGAILWKKELNGKILGTIAQIDIYKNGRLQLAFATQDKVYVLDRNGKDVGNFPLSFKDKITQPLSVFDYDKNKNYRLLITQDKSLIMYDVKGKKVSGFNAKAVKNNISTQPKHFRLSNKDYIVFVEGETLEILNRQGQTRINVTNKIKFSNNPIFEYQNKFTTTNTLGQLVQVDTKGKVVTKALGLAENHSIESTSKTLVSLSENKLNIRNRSIDLDYGQYTKPRIFYINDKIYVTVSDKQAKKVYLFDSQAKSIPNFPVFGISSAELQNLDKNKDLELITKSDSKTVTVYKLN